MNYICPKYFSDSFPKKCDQTLNYIQDIPLMIQRQTYKAVEVINKDPNKC